MTARVLVVDDNAASLKLLTYLIHASGFPVEGVSNAHHALAAAKDSTSDLILTDLGMPGVDGFELLKRLRALPGFETTPIVAVTALAMDGDRENVMKAGFDGYISKPIDPASFILRVRSFLGDDSGR